MSEANLQPLDGVKVVRLWKLEIRYEEGEKTYFGTWKWGKGDRLVGNFLYVKPEKKGTKIG